MRILIKQGNKPVVVIPGWITFHVEFAELMSVPTPEARWITRNEGKRRNISCNHGAHPNHTVSSNGRELMS